MAKVIWYFLLGMWSGISLVFGLAIYNEKGSSMPFLTIASILWMIISLTFFLILHIVLRKWFKEEKS